MNHNDQNAWLDLLDAALPQYTRPATPHSRQPRRPLAVTARITWIDGSHGDALRKTQGRALRAVLLALRAHPAEPEHPPQHLERGGGAQ